MIADYRTSRVEDCAVVAPLMRSQDVTEVMYSNGLDPLEALTASFEASQVCNTIVHGDGSLVGMFGVADNGVFGCPWLLGTDRLPEISRQFIPRAREWVLEMNDTYPLLLNYVHSKNTVSKRWLKSLGFEFIKLEKEFGVGKQPFYQFVRIQKNV